MKNMKRFSAVVGAAALVAVAFTGCNNSFAGTDLNYSEKELEKIGNEGLGVSVTGGSVSVDTTSITKSSRATVKVTVTNNNGTKVSDSAADGITFHNAKDASKAAYKYTHEDAQLPKTKVFAVTETTNSKTFEFEIDASSVTKNVIVVKFDATKIKDKQGTAILNTNGNDKRGEESDTEFRTISVGVKAGEAALPSPVGSGVESYQGYNLSNFVGTPAETDRLDSNNKLTKSIFFVANPVAYAKTLSDYEGNNFTVNKDLAGKLNSAYKLRVRKADSTSYTEQALSFEYKTSYTNGSLTNNNTNGYYVSQDITLDYGTVYELVETAIDVNDIVPDYTATVYGHKAYTRTKGFGARDAVSGQSGRVDVFTAQPTFIIDGYSSAATSAVSTWDPRSKAPAAIAAAQKSYFKAVDATGNVFNYDSNNRVFTLRLDDSAAKAYRLAFASESNDFLVVNTDNNNNNIEQKLHIKVSYKKDDAHIDDLNNYVRIEITNKSVELNGTPKLYIGNGVKLATNYAYPTEVTFGAYKDAAEGITSGYVPLN